MTIDPTAAIHDMHARYKAALTILGRYVEKHGLLQGREDETLGIGAIVLQEAAELFETHASDQATVARDGTVQTTGDLRYAMLPIDDVRRDHADTLLPDAVVEAGMDAIDRAREDLDAEDPTRPDWDDGMVAVAVYRAMTAAVRLRPYGCTAASAGTDAVAEKILAIDPEDAARRFALRTHAALGGDWTGGEVLVRPGPVDPAAPVIELFDRSFMVEVRTTGLDARGAKTVEARIAD